MKKIISLMLGLSLVAGVAAMAFGQPDTDKQKAKAAKKKKNKKGTDTTVKKAQ